MYAAYGAGNPVGAAVGVLLGGSLADSGRYVFPFFHADLRVGSDLIDWSCRLVMAGVQRSISHAGSASSP